MIGRIAALALFGWGVKRYMGRRPQGRDANLPLSPNAGERLQQTHAGGAFAGAPTGLDERAPGEVKPGLSDFFRGS
jgi:hypothetical protein